MRMHGFKSPALAAALVYLLVSITSAHPGSPQSEAIGALDAQTPVTYFIADGSGQAGYRAPDRELARWALEAWQRSAGGNLHFEPANESAARIRLYWSESNDGTYGEMRPLMVGGQRGAALFIEPDVELLGPEIASHARADALLRDSIVYLTCLHELGHALGLAHTRDFRDIMYFLGYGGNIVEYFSRYRAQVHSRNGIAKVSGLSDADVSHIRSLYVGK
jgi:hypothetical protein